MRFRISHRLDRDSLPCINAPIIIYNPRVDKNVALTPFAKAQAAVLRAVKPLPAVRLPLEQAFGFVLREHIRADRPLPPFNRSAMDGYAVRHADLAKGLRRFRCVGTLEAGAAWRGAVRPGECLKIMTGAPVPPGLDAVEQVEKSISDGPHVELFTDAPERWQHIHRMGADCKKGERLIAAGETLTPSRVAVAAAVGAARVAVTRAVRVTVVASGSELVGVAAAPAPYQIRDSNSRFLMARFFEMPWAAASFGGVIPDDPRALRRALAAALKRSDMVIVTGGVSMGERDHIPEVLKQCGVQNRLYKSAIRPGKPVWFGVKGAKAVFGLPGNPVSVAATFREFVLPALRKMAGCTAVLPSVLRLPLAAPAKKKHALREFRVSRS
ncbi:MAG: molybdopterin molybdenumtransferase MoeA, partial [Candidatus Nitrosotenuis sp.]